MATTEKSEEEIWLMSKSVHLLPIVAISAVYLVIGVVGNATVCFVSIVRMRRSVLNNFVLSLAFVELFGCMFTIPIEITQILNIYSFDYPWLCKFERYLRSFIVFFTSCLLIAIATERYQRIVKPHRKHVTSFQFWVTLFCSFFLSLIAALPEALIAGTEVIVTEFGTGRTCSTYSSDKYADTIYPPLWACFVVVIYVISTTAIGSIYCVIAVQIWKRGKFITDRRSRPNTPDLTLKRRVDHLRTSCDDNNCHANNHSSTGTCSDPLYSEDVYYRSRSHTSTMTRSEDPDEITPLPELRDNQKTAHHSNRTFREPRSSVSEDAEAIIHKNNALQNEDSVSEASDGNRTPKERNSLFSEIISYFQSRPNASVSRNNSTCTEHSKFSFLEKRSSKEHRSSVFGGDHKETKEDIEENKKHLQSDGQNNSDASKGSQNQNKNEHQKQRTQQSQDVRRKLTAVFFDELAVTVDHRRRRATFSTYAHKTASCDDLFSSPPPASFGNTPLSLSPMGSVRSRAGGYSRKRTTFIMFIMTLTTVLSLLPHVIVMLYRLHDPSVESRLSPDNSVFFRVAWNSFFISLAAHPYVYGFWNGRFKKALLSLFDDVRKESRRSINRVRKASGFEFK